MSFVHLEVDEIGVGVCAGGEADAEGPFAVKVGAAATVAFV